jgi:hypothetical protein
MAKHRYLVLLRNQPTTGGQSPSPEQIQQMLAAYRAWMERFKNEIADIGDKLKPGGRVLTASGVADGPFVEAKEVVGGYMIVSAESFEQAVEVVRACPAVQMPGTTLEIRELAGGKM